jgi:hypothetical protein
VRCAHIAECVSETQSSRLAIDTVEKHTQLPKQLTVIFLNERGGTTHQPGVDCVGSPTDLLNSAQRSKVAFPPSEDLHHVACLFGRHLHAVPARFA